MEHTPLTPEEYQLWKDTALLDGDAIDRFAATIDRPRAVNAKLLEALREIDRALSIGGKGEHHARMLARARLDEEARK